jgi:hypothetical protein
MSLTQQEEKYIKLMIEGSVTNAIAPIYEEIKKDREESKKDRVQFMQYFEKIIEKHIASCPHGKEVSKYKYIAVGAISLFSLLSGLLIFVLRNHFS